MVIFHCKTANKPLPITTLFTPSVVDTAVTDVFLVYTLVPNYTTCWKWQIGANYLHKPAMQGNYPYV